MGVSRRQLCKLTGVPATTIRYIENGRIKNPGWETVCTIFAFFGLKPVFAISDDVINRTNNVIYDDEDG